MLSNSFEQVSNGFRELDKYIEMNNIKNCNHDHHGPKPGCECLPPPPHRKEFIPYDGNDIYYPGVPNPVMTHYCTHIEKPCHPERDKYVTKKELNTILNNIAEADIFTDLSVDGTTTSVGCIKKGSRLGKITFSEFIYKLLYSKEPEPEPGEEYITKDDLDGYVTKEYLEETLNKFGKELNLSKVAYSGSYNDLSDKPEIINGDYEYPCKDSEGNKVLNDTVVTPLGGFDQGQSLEGMKISKIIETLLCKDSFGVYLWKSDFLNLPAGESEIDMKNTYIDNESKKYDNDGKIVDFYNDVIVNGKYELYAVVRTQDIDKPDIYKYDCLIASYESQEGDNPQKTNASLPDIDASTMWSWDYENSKIELTQGITGDMSLILIRRV